MIGRRVLSGGTPFDPINIEDAYDTVLRLVRRDQDILSEFVQGWDPVLTFMKPVFDEHVFMKGIIDSVQDQTRGRLNHGILHVDQSRLRQAAESISTALHGAKDTGRRADISSIYIDILVKILSNPSASSDYIDDLVDFCADNDAVVGTLNYDLIFEKSASKLGHAVDYGLAGWEKNQIVRWTKGQLKLAKIHGSINWSGDADKFVVLPDAPTLNRWQQSNALMIFGAQSSKLTPDGPFLQLRHQYESLLMRRDTLIIVGYSFGDAHINSMLKRWVSTRKKAKMVIVDPSTVPYHLGIFRDSYVHTEQDKRMTVELIHVQKTAALGMKDAVGAARQIIDSSYPSNRSGFLPQVLAKTIN